MSSPQQAATPTTPANPGLDRPLIVAHRGMTPGGIENSRSAIAQAVAAGAELVEIDVRLSLDRRPVVFHDAFLRRTTPARGWIRLWPSFVLSRIPFRDAPHGDRISTLASVLRTFPANAQVALHLKDRAALPSVLRLVRRHGVPDRTWLWLEHERDAYRATRALRGVRITLLRAAGWTPGNRQKYVEEAQWFGASGISVPWGVIDEPLLTLAHQHHLMVFSVLERMDTLPALVAMGLDGIITKDPAAVRAMLQPDPDAIS